MKERKHGYLEALRQHRIAIEKELVVCEKMTYEEGREATRRLLELPSPPDAILAMNDTLAFAAMKEIKKHGLRIPQDIALIGYTDELHSNYVEPASPPSPTAPTRWGKRPASCCCRSSKKKRNRNRSLYPPTSLSGNRPDRRTVRLWG